MSLSIYAQAVASKAELDWRKNLDLITMVEGSPKSRQLTQMFRAANPGGLYAWQMTLPTFTLDNLVTLDSDGYATASTYAASQMDPTSVSYAKQTDGSLTPKVDRIALCTVEIAELEAAAHPVGNQLLNMAASAAQQKIRDEMTKHFLSAVEARGQLESAGSPFTVTLTTEATFKTDFDEVIGAVRKQDGGNYKDWVMVLPIAWEGVMSMMDIVGNKDYVYNSGTPTGPGVVSGRVYQMFGMNVVFSPHFSDDDTGFIFNLDKVGLIAPLPIQSKAFTYHGDPLSNFYAFYRPWGIQCLGKNINCYDDATSSTQQEGIIHLALA